MVISPRLTSSSSPYRGGPPMPRVVRSIATTRASSTMVRASTSPGAPPAAGRGSPSPGALWANPASPGPRAGSSAVRITSTRSPGSIRPAWLVAGPSSIATARVPGLSTVARNPGCPGPTTALRVSGSPGPDRLPDRVAAQRPGRRLAVVLVLADGHVLALDDGRIEIEVEVDPGEVVHPEQRADRQGPDRREHPGLLGRGVGRRRGFGGRRDRDGRRRPGLRASRSRKTNAKTKAVATGRMPNSTIRMTMR